MIYSLMKGALNKSGAVKFDRIQNINLVCNED